MTLNLQMRSSSCLNPCCNGICSASFQTIALLAAPTKVLILVVMEYALREYWASKNVKERNSLNPCCNGICSARKEVKPFIDELDSLNPCCNGICSARIFSYTLKDGSVVLILVVMEYALRVIVWTTQSKSHLMS